MTPTLSQHAAQAAGKPAAALAVTLISCAPVTWMSSAALTLFSSGAAHSAEIGSLEVGLTAGGSAIEAWRVEAGRGGARTVALVGSLGGVDTSAAAIRAEVEAYAASRDADRVFDLVAIPVANPDGGPLVFPPTGAAYREHPESHALWRWLGLHAPDLVLVVGEDAAGLADALERHDVAGVGSIPASRVEIPERRVAIPAGRVEPAAALNGRVPKPSLLAAVPADLPPSEAHREIEARRARTPQALANLLAPVYGRSFDPPIYTDGMALIAHLQLGNLDHVETLAAPYVDGTRDSLASRFGVSSLVLAGHLVFAALAEATGDSRYAERARAAADLAFTSEGQMLEAMPGHGEMSDAIFMGASILAAVGDLTGEIRYFDMAARQIDFMNALVRRGDGLYRHSPLTDAAWGRGNGFAAIGYALTLSHLPADHPSHARLLAEYRALMTTLARWQNGDGTWRQVVDHPGAYHETSSTAIIGFSMQRGLNRGWLDAAEFDAPAARAFQAVSMRTDGNGGFIDVSESTNKQASLEAYLLREALFGRDPRTGSFAMLFGVERAIAGTDRTNGSRGRADIHVEGRNHVLIEWLVEIVENDESIFEQSETRLNSPGL